MPTYSYQCKCGHLFDKTHNISEYSPKEKCPICKKLASRSFENIRVQIFMEATTLGSVAERNTSRLSNDEKEKLRKEHHKYREEAPFDMKLPEGASRLPVDNKGKYIAPSKQRKRDIRKKNNG